MPTQASSVKHKRSCNMVNHTHILDASTFVSLEIAPLQITATLQITPLFALHYEEIANAYRDGLRTRLQAGNGLLAVNYLVNYLHSAIDRHWFDKQHEAQLRQFVGFVFGEIHGKVLTLNGTRRRDVTTLVRLNSEDEKRGYRAGRLWFFYETTPDERALTDDELLQRLHEYVTDALTWNDPEGVWYYTI